jgi:hypothetical protein
MIVDEITVTCPGDNGRAHESRPQIIQKFYRTESPGHWTPATVAAKAQRTEKQRRATHDRRGKPAGVGTALLGELKHVYECRLCGNGLQVGTGQWPRMEAALEALATLGGTATIDTLRYAYSACEPSTGKLAE